MDFQKYWTVAQQHIIEFGPKLLAAVAILVVAYLIAKLLAYAARLFFDNSGIGEGTDLGSSVGRALFWVTMLIALPAILGALGMSGLLEPMQAMATDFLKFVPNLAGAGLIFGIGYVVARVAQEALTSVLQAFHIDDLAERFGITAWTGDDEELRATSSRDLDDEEDDDDFDFGYDDMETEATGLAGFFGTLAFTLLIIPVAIAALDTLGIESVSAPAKQMLQSVLSAIPNIFAACVVLGLAYLIGRFASQAATNLLPTTGVDKVTDRLGFSKELVGDYSVSKIVGALAFLAIMIFGLVEAAKLLDFAILSDAMTHVLTLGGRILLGTIIIGFGVIAADFIADIVAKSKDAAGIAPALKIAIIVLAVAMGLRQMGLANEIINTGFTFLIGALAVGAAIAIGLGGKDTAGRLLEKWTSKF